MIKNLSTYRKESFGKSAEFAEKYLRKGIKIVAEGRLQTGSYEKDGHKVYTTEVVIENQEFSESKAVSDRNAAGSGAGVNTETTPQYRDTKPATQKPDKDGFMQYSSNLDGELPF